MLADKIAASGLFVSFAIDELERLRLAGTAEINRLEKLLVKAEQRLSARYGDLRRVQASVCRSLTTSGTLPGVNEAVAAAQMAWDRAADDRLRIVVRLASVYRLLSPIPAADDGLAHYLTRRPQIPRNR